MKKNPSHKTHDTEVSMVSRQANYWLPIIFAKLDEDQQNSIQLYLRGHHVLLIAGAGCGKTHVSKQLLRLLFAMYGEDYLKNHSCGIAMTNIIANNMSYLSFEGKYFYFFIYVKLLNVSYFVFVFFKLLKGNTIFSWLGLGEGKKETKVDQYVDLFLQNLTESRRTSISNLTMLFVEEAFLFSNLMFAVLYEILEYIFDDHSLPTSHIQIWFVGDPKQLLCFDQDKTLAKLKCFCADVAPFQNDGIFSKFFAILLRTGLIVKFLTKAHRMIDPSFLDTLNLVTFIFFTF